MRSTVRRVLWLTVAVLWLLLGIASYANGGSLPFAGSGVWLLGAAIPAGSALAVVRHDSSFARRTYVTTVAVYALGRGLAYLIELQITTPSFVWLIVLCSAVISHNEGRFNP